MNRVIIYTALINSLLFQNTLFGQSFSINGRITNLSENAVIRLYDTEDKTIIDTAMVKNNSFLLKGNLSKAPRSIVLHIQDNEVNLMEYLYIGNEDVRMVGNLDAFPTNLEVSGSKFQIAKSKLDKKLLPLVKKQQEKGAEIKKLYETGKWNDSLQEIYVGKNGIMTKIEDEKRIVEKKFIQEKSNTNYSVSLLNLYKSNFYTDEELLSIYKKLSKKLRATDDAKAIRSYLDYPKLKIGDSYRDFHALDKNGKNINFSQFFKGIYILLDFSTPTCGSSMDSRLMLQELQKQLQGKLEIISYYTEKNKEHFDFFSNPENYKWSFLWNTDGNFNETILKYRVGGTPTFFVFDPSGKLLDTWRGFDENTSNKIKQLIGH